MRFGLLMCVVACGKVNSTGADAAIDVPADAPQAPHMLAVMIGGSATTGVMVTSDVGPISCGATCNATYAYGTKVTLTATPAGAVRFIGGGCMSVDTCTVTVTDDLTIKASTCNPAGHTFVSTGTMQLYTVTAGCSSVIVDAFGGQGGGANGGKGAEIKGTVDVADGEMLKILVGAAGTGGLTNCTAPGYGSGGGGGSFVTRLDNTPLVIAGGGGGAGLNGDVGQPGGISESGGDLQGALGGTNGNGGAIGTPDTGGCGFRGSGGGGLLGDGALSVMGGGVAFINGGGGGIDPPTLPNDCCMQAQGGFGGGGAGGNGGGGGGGYSGGAGGSNGGAPVQYPGGGGGGSFNAGLDQVMTAGIRSGAGQVIVTPKL
jgi:hypothetical protein